MNTKTSSFLPRKAAPPKKNPSVDLSQVERLADLSRLSLSAKEAERLRRELSSILEYFATLDNVEMPRGTQGGELPPEHGGMRDDVVRPSTPAAILEGVPKRRGRYVRAPRVF